MCWVRDQQYGVCDPRQPTTILPLYEKSIPAASVCVCVCLCEYVYGSAQYTGMRRRACVKCAIEYVCVRACLCRRRGRSLSGTSTKGDAQMRRCLQQNINTSQTKLTPCMPTWEWKLHQYLNASNGRLGTINILNRQFNQVYGRHTSKASTPSPSVRDYCATITIYKVHPTHSTLVIPKRI